MIRTQLGQFRPANTTAAALYSNTDGKPFNIDCVAIVNTTDVAALASVFHDFDGTTYSEATTIAWELIIPGNTVVHYEPHHGISGYSNLENVAVKTSIANALTFTAYGVKEGQRY
jgi:hypothetical protein